MNEIDIPPFLKNIFSDIHNAGGDPFIVGGAVRDLLFGLPINDFDVEVFNLSVENLEEILSRFGQVDRVGKSFGILILRRTGEKAYEFALPRRENKEGRGHKGFIVDVDPAMTVKEAAARRDFTINSLYYSPLEDQIINPYNGVIDIEDRVLKATTEAYMEDPLRVLRGFHFIARFDLTPEAHTVYMSRKMFKEYEDIPKERVWQEWKKWATKGTAMLQSLDWLRQTNWIEAYPELGALIGVEQDKVWHPEGTVFKHTMLAVEAVAKRAVNLELTDEEKLTVIFATLLHDVGKATTTEVSETTGRIIAKNHSEVGAGLAEDFLMRIGAPKWLIEKVVPLVREHMFYATHDPTARSVRRLSVRLEPATIDEFLGVVYGDIGGRGKNFTVPKKTRMRLASILRHVDLLAIRDSAPDPILMGRHLLKMGIDPGPAMGRILRSAYDAQIEGEFDNLEGAMEWAQERREDV